MHFKSATSADRELFQDGQKVNRSFGRQAASCHAIHRSDNIIGLVIPIIASNKSLKPTRHIEPAQNIPAEI